MVSGIPSYPATPSSNGLERTRVLQSQLPIVFNDGHLTRNHEPPIGKGVENESACSCGNRSRGARFASGVSPQRGGDTWSAIQVVGQQDERLPQFMPRVHPPVTRQIVWEGSEDGDPCPELGVLQEQAAAEADLQHRVAPVEAARALSGSGSEGGDTWSRFLPRPQARPTRTAGLIFA